ncbi:MAG TPA: MarR family winged helix-turn-helix transcriptional regulator [Solirubrobacterales bacterium]|jgi:DNA-binding MarR family transcriptional regulator
MALKSPTKVARPAAASPIAAEATCAATADLPAAILIARIARLVRSRLEAALGPSELRQRQLVALSYLRNHGPARQQSLAQSLCMDASSLVCLLNDLEGRDLVVRRRDREDRRRGILELTDHGREALAEIDAALAEIDAEILFELDEAERAELRSLLGRLGV